MTLSNYRSRPACRLAATFRIGACTLATAFLGLLTLPASADMIGVPWTGEAGIPASAGTDGLRSTSLAIAGTEVPVQKPVLRPDRSGLGSAPGAPDAASTGGTRTKATLSRGGLFTPQVVGTNFLGATLADCNAFPPDTMGAVGPTQFIVALNGRLRSFNKSTGAADGALNTNFDAFFAPVMTPVGGAVIGNFTSDPHIRYDRLSGRWFIVMIDVPYIDVNITTVENRVLVAVSNGSTVVNAASFTLFQFRHDQVSTVGDTGGFADYPTLGIDANALYIGDNVFSNSTGSFTGCSAFVVRKSSILGAGPIVVTAFRGLCAGTGDGPFTPQGVDNYDPAATQGYFIGVSNAAFSKLMIRRISDPGGTPTISADIPLTVPTTTFPTTVPHLGNTGGTNGNLDAVDDRLYAAHMRNGRLWTAHNIRVSSAGVASTASGARNAARWYEIQNLDTSPALVQSGTVFDNAATVGAAKWYWIPTIVVSGQGHAALGCSVAGAASNINAATIGRLATDTLGTMQTPFEYTASSTAYNPPSDPGGTGGRRWGDYSMTCLDPNDDMTMWTIQEFCNATNSYGVQVARLAAPPPATPVSCSPASVAAGQASVSVTVTGTQVSGSGFFDPGAGFLNRIAGAVSGGVTVNSVTYNSPTSVTLNLNTTGATAGAKNVTITNPDGQALAGTGILTVTSSSIVVPNANETVEGPGNNIFPFASGGFVPMRYQQVYASSQFGGSTVTITQLVFRRDSTQGAASFTIPDIQIELMTTSANVAAPSATFSSNRGADAVVVYPRATPMAFSSSGTATPQAFDLVVNLVTPFTYNPAAGNLLMEVRHYGTTSPGVSFDAVNSGEVGRVYDNTSANPDTVTTGTVNGGTTGLVTKFVTGSGAAPAPAPIASAIGDVITGSGAPNAAGADDGTKYDVLKRGGYLAENGNLVFPGYLLVGTGGVTTTPNNYMGLWKNNGTGLKLFARSGNDAPETGGTAAKYDVLPQTPAINDSGEVTFLASLAISGASTPATTVDNDTGLWSELGSTGLGILIREGDTIPPLTPLQVGAFVSGAFATAHTGASTGEAAFAVTMKNGSTDTAILRTSIVSGSVTAVGVVARQNTAMPGVAGEQFGNLAGTYSDAIRMDATGNLSFVALSVSNRESIWYQPVTGGAPVKAFIAGTAATGDTAPGTGGATFKNIKSPSIGSAGTISFRGFLNANGDNTGGKKGDGIWRGTTGGGFACILRAGDDNAVRPGLGLPVGALVGNLWHSWLTNANHGAWKGWLDVNGDGTSAAPADVNAIYTDLSGTMKLALKVGDTAPGIAGATFSGFDLPVVGGVEQMAFLGTVTGGGITAANNKGVWRSASNGGALTLVLRTGDTMVTSQGTKTISNVDFPGSNTTDRRWEQPIMDSTGRLLVYVTFVGGATCQVLVPGVPPL